MERVLTQTHMFPAKNGADIQVDGFAVLDNTGNFVTPAAGTGLVVLGIHTDGGTGDGSSKLWTCTLGGQVLAENDGTDAVTVAHIGKYVYLAGPHSVSSKATGGSVAGVCKGFFKGKVLVQIA